MTQTALYRTRILLDARLTPLKPAERFKPPPRGWVKAVQQALGMSGVQFALRLGVRPQTVAALEKSEMSGSIQLSTLQRAAEALDCTLVYALVPKTTLEANVKNRAEKIARDALARATLTMKLEDQELSNTNLQNRIDDYIATYVNERQVWDKT